MNYPKAYEEYLKLPMPELAEIMAGREETGSKANFAKLIYEERQMQERHRYEKEQIELQHKLNLELMNKQLRWIKFSAILNAIALLAAVLLGWFLQELKSSPNLSINARPTLQSQIESSTSATRSEKKDGKAPFTPVYKR